MRHRSPRLARRRLALLLPLAVALSAGVSTAASAPGDPMPYFRFPWLSGEEAPGSPELFAEAPHTVLVVWNRACPRCTGLALQCDALDDSLRRFGVPVLGLLFGPDDPSALQDRLRADGIRTPHLWDASGLIARDLEMGDRHLGVFLVDAQGTIIADLDDEIPELVPPVLSALRAAGEQRSTTGEPRPAAAEVAPPVTSRPTPRFAVDGRWRLSNTDGSRSGDTGLFGETLEPGAALIARWDLRAHWPVAPGIEFVPRLRLSNEDAATLQEGAEPWANRYGTASLLLRRGRLRAALGAFETCVAPLVLQRWDADDAPPLGGNVGCACGGAGPAGVGPRSLEILGPNYSLEGMSIGLSERWFRARAELAVPRWEETSTASDPWIARSESHYRRVLTAGVIDLGAAGREDPRTGLSAPWGVRLARVAIEDDRRTIDPSRATLPGREQDERSWSAWLALRPRTDWLLEGEGAWWTGDERVRESQTGRPEHERTEARAFRAGGGYERTWARTHLSARLHWIRTDPGFAPHYRALTYQADREGWRVRVGAEWHDPGGAKERLAADLLYRRVRESQDDPQRRLLPGAGRIRETLASAVLRMRPTGAWQAEGAVVLSEVDYPRAALVDERKELLSLSLRWEGWAALDPVFPVRLDPPPRGVRSRAHRDDAVALGAGERIAS